MGMEVEQAAVGLHTEDPAAQAIAELQEFTKVFMPGLPCAPKQQFAEPAYATQITTQQLVDGEGDVPMIQGMNDFPDFSPNIKERLLVQLGQTPRARQEKATKKSCPQPAQRTRATPFSRGCRTQERRKPRSGLT